MLRLLTKAVLDATDALALLTVFLTIAVFVFASFIWYAERGIWTDARECFVQDGDCSEFPEHTSVLLLGSDDDDDGWLRRHVSVDYIRSGRGECGDDPWAFL